MLNPVNFPSGANNLPPVKISGNEEKKIPEQIEMRTDTPYIPPPVSLYNIPKGLFVDKERFDNPKLDRIDKKLVEKYISANNKEPVKKLIRDRLIMDFSEMLNKYTGREDTVKTGDKYYALKYLVDPLNIFSEQESVEIILECAKSDLTAEDQTLIDDFMKDPGSEEAKSAVLTKLYNYQYMFQGTVLGSGYRAKLFREMTIFNELASFSGISDQEIYYATLLDRDQIPDGQELSDMLDLYVAADTPEKSDDEAFQEKAIEYLKGSMRDFFDYLNLKRPSLGTISYLSSRYVTYEDLAVKLGVPPEQVINMENEVKSEFKIKSGKREGDTGIFSPDDLPHGVKDLLKRTELREGYSYFQFVKDNCEHIVISKNKYTSDSLKALIGGRPDGQTIADGTIYINMVADDMKKEGLSSDMYLYDVILHEAHHLYNRKTYFVSDQNKLRSAPNEGSTYGFEAEALKKLDVKGLPESQAKALKDVISYDEAMSKAANVIYDKKDIENAVFGLSDLDTYPSNTPYFMAYGYADTLIRSGLIRENETQYFIDVFSQIIIDKASIGDVPNKVKDVFNALLNRMPDLDEFTGYEAKLKEYNNLLSDHYGLDMLQGMLQYSADYMLNKNMVAAVRLLDDNGKPLGIVPKDAKIKLLMADPITINDTTYVKVATSGKTGYLVSDSLVNEIQ